MKLPAHRRLLSRFRIHGAVPPLPHSRSWREHIGLLFTFVKDVKCPQNTDLRPCLSRISYVVCLAGRLV